MATFLYSVQSLTTKKLYFQLTINSHEIMSYDLLYSRKQPPELLSKKGVLAEDCDFIKKEALAGVFL